MIKLLQLFLVSLPLVFSQAMAAGNSPGPLENFLDGFENFHADFKQTLSNERGEVLEISSGVMYMQSPGKFRWVYKAPYSQILVTDGDVLWMYDVDLEQVTVRNISETMDNTPAAIISGQSRVDEYYRKVNLGNIEGFDWIELQPKAADNQYSKVRLGFDGDRLGMMILFDNLGQITRIDFINARKNTRLDAGLFRFNSPQGVDVIDERQSTQ
ncbi:MAG TPA: outer membrane lipoprotein chaperone LolA [Gammaproteobacteria bacterium]